MNQLMSLQTGTTLNRDVAMKALSGAFRSDPDRLHDSSASSAHQLAHLAGHDD
jgi:hypothetical protein